MRLAFFFLLLANLVLLVWSRGYFGLPEEGREPERMQRQITPEKLHILPASGAVAATPATTVPLSCKRIAWLTAAETGSIRDALASLSGWSVSQSARQAADLHWVAVPGLASRELAQKKKVELLQLGIKEGEVVEDARHGPFVLSLGLFNNRKFAEDHLQTLTRRGVRSAQMLKRESAAESYALDLRAPVGQLDGRLTELMTVLPQATLTDCPEP